MANIVNDSVREKETVSSKASQAEANPAATLAIAKTLDKKVLSSLTDARIEDVACTSSLCASE